MIKRSKRFLGKNNLPNMEMLQSVLKEHQVGFERMSKLRDMYNAKNPILQRTRREGLPNNKMAHAYARYITSIAVGYLIGKPVTYSTAGDSNTMRQIQDIFKRSSEPAENAQIARDQSIYGKGVEYVHVDDSDHPMPHTTAISPLNAFVVYSDTYDMEPLFGVYYIKKTKADGTEDGWSIWVMSDKVIAQYEAKELGGTMSLCGKVRQHYFGGVPIIEYWNDDTEKGDFEWVETQIDAYDKLQSDRVNDKEQFVDKLLVITGAVLEEDERGRKPMQQLKEDHALQLPDSQSKADYLSSTMDESGNEILRNNILEDIHKLSLVPDMSDENFASNASGVAMRYKLWCLEQLTQTKERWFAEGLRYRLKLYINFLVVKGYETLDVADIKINFTHSLPANLSENAQTVRDARSAGAASTETAVKMLHTGEEWTDEDNKKEVAAIQKERAQEARASVMDDFEEIE